MSCRFTLAMLASIAGAAAGLASEPYPSMYEIPASLPVLIRGATILTGTGTRIEGGDLLIVHGRIEAVGNGLKAPPDGLTIDATGRWVTPGLIDVHSHLGVFASPGSNAHADGNEATSPNTANVWAEHSIWPQDPGFETALAGGVTTLQLLPGSANLFGGRTAVVKNVAAVAYQEMKFPGAPHGLKMACGENPKRAYGRKSQAPSTRMGSMAAYRQAFAEAQDYGRQWQKFERERAAFDRAKTNMNSAHEDRKPAEKTAGESKEAQPPNPPKRDLRLETLVGVLGGEILVHIHCYRADEMVAMISLAEEFGFRIAAFHHGVEAYKIADRLATNHICGALWSDWWGFKMEAYDGIQENLALVDLPPGGCAIVHSDSVEVVQRLNQEAAKAMARGLRAGLQISPERAIRWLTANPATALGIAATTGTLEPGKMADVVVWNGNPFSVYATADQVFIDGVLRFDRLKPPARPRSDFMLGQPGASAQ